MFCFLVLLVVLIVCLLVVCGCELGGLVGWCLLCFRICMVCRFLVIMFNSVVGFNCDLLF